MRPALVATLRGDGADPAHRVRQRRRADARPGGGPRLGARGALGARRHPRAAHAAARRRGAASSESRRAWSARRSPPAASGVLARSLPLGAWGESATFDWTMFAVALAIALGAVLLVVLVPAVSLWRGDLRGSMSSARTGWHPGPRRSARARARRGRGRARDAHRLGRGAARAQRDATSTRSTPASRRKGIAVVDVDLEPRAWNRRCRLQRVDEITARARRAAGRALGRRGHEGPAARRRRQLRHHHRGRESSRSARSRTSASSRRTTSRRWASSCATGGRSTCPTHRRADTARCRWSSTRRSATKYFPGENPIGKRLGGGFGGSQRIVGVVANVAEAALTDEPEPARYYLASQVEWFGNAATLRRAHDAAGRRAGAARRRAPHGQSRRARVRGAGERRRCRAFSTPRLDRRARS